MPILPLSFSLGPNSGCVLAHGMPLEIQHLCQAGLCNACKTRHKLERPRLGVFCSACSDKDTTTMNRSIMQTSRSCFCDAGITLKDRSAKVHALGSTSADGIFHSRARATGTRKARSASCGSLDSWMAPRARINTRAGQKHKPRSVANQIPRWAVPRLACILKVSRFPGLPV